MTALRRPTEAIRYGEQAVRLLPRSRNAHNGLGISYVNAGRYREALQQFEEVRHLGGAGAGPMGLVYGLTGDTAKARQILVEMQSLRPTRGSWQGVALVYLGLGDKERAAAAIARADSAGDKGGIPLLGPLYDPIRDDPRFRAFLDKARRGAS